MAPSPFTIRTIECWPLDLALTDPFVVATGQLTVAQNVVVRLTLHGGAVGVGEAAPFPDISGETRESTLHALQRLAPLVLGQPATEWRRVAQGCDTAMPDAPAALCAIETALLDALCQAMKVPLWTVWGGADVRPRETDITIPIASAERTLVLAREWYAKGFRLLKMKVGTDVEEDIRRIESLVQVLPDVRFLPDGNQGFSEQECRYFTTEVQRRGATIVLLEQPLVREDLEGMAAIRRDLAVSIAADESVRSLEDVKAVVRTRAADFVNVKITKTGVMQGVDIAQYARHAGLRLMIGGMVETRVAMGCSFAMVLGLGGFEVLDLDTPLLLATDPITGGYRYEGPTLLPWAGSGLGLQTAPATDCLTWE
jgi:o-succinylbenzoate synthase